jgi:two-component system NtrC family sensor kinase
VTRRSRTSRWLRLSIERNVVLLVGAAVAAAVLGVSLIPEVFAGVSRALATAAIAGAVAVVFGLIGQRQIGKLHARLSRAEREAQQTEHLASVGRVAAGIAHEVGNPLTGISNYTHVLRSRVEASSDAEAALIGIEREVERIDKIVGGLLDYARPGDRAPAAFDAGQSLRAAVQLLVDQGVFRRVELSTAIDESPLSLTGNSHELEQAFVNLLLNAIDAMEAQGKIALYAGRMTPDAMLRSPRRAIDGSTQAFERRVHPRLEAWRARRAPDTPCAKFVIADSGVGVGDDEVGRIFDPFFTTKKTGEGTGLGLAIVQRIVDAHEGVVWVQPAREGGAAFHVVLPLDAFGQRQPTEPH